MRASNPASPPVPDGSPSPVLPIVPAASAAPAAPAALAGIPGPVNRILVLRALVLGDTLCAVPALRSIRRAWPRAHIVYMGLPASRDYLSRLDCVDEWRAFPGWPGLPEASADVRQLPAFVADMQAGDWDLAIQLHGSGGVTNPLLALFGARHAAGFRGEGAWAPPADAHRFVDWPLLGHESQRLLSLCRHLGLPEVDDRLEFPLRDEDDHALRQVWPAVTAAGPYACLHAGAQLPSRRWPLRRFAAVGRALHDMGQTVVLTGTAAERPLTAELSGLLAAQGVPCVDLAGATTLWSLGALLRGARVLVCNDTGVSHIAAALSVPSVVVSCGSDPLRWSPPDQRRHRVLARPAPCRPCAHAECPHGHPCAHALSVFDVLRTLEDLLGTVPFAPLPPAKEPPHAPTPAHPDLACPRQLPVQSHAGPA